MPWDGRLKSYLRTAVFILNAPEKIDPPAVGLPVAKHDFNCRAMRRIFTENSDAEVVWIHMPEESEEEDLLERIDRELEGKTEDDLIVVYFEGHAYGENAKYYWYVPFGIGSKSSTDRLPGILRVDPTTLRPTRSSTGSTTHQLIACSFSIATRMIVSRRSGAA